MHLPRRRVARERDRAGVRLRGASVTSSSGRSVQPSREAAAARAQRATEPPAGSPPVGPSSGLPYKTSVSSFGSTDTAITRPLGDVVEREVEREQRAEAAGARARIVARRHVAVGRVAAVAAAVAASPSAARRRAGALAAGRRVARRARGTRVT